MADPNIGYVLRGGLPWHEHEAQREADKKRGKPPKERKERKPKAPRVGAFEVYGYVYVGREFNCVINMRAWRMIGVFISDAGEWEYWEASDTTLEGERIMRGKTVWWRYVATI